jgi:signal transduction histidine kinase
MHDIFADLVGLIELNAQTKKIHINTNLPEDIIVFADDNALKTILRNLASNALKFTPEGGIITLSAKNYDQNYVQIAVNDTGVGMDAITMTKIFRIDSKHSTKGTQGEGGTGLGLLLCKEFAEKNGGTISVESIVEVGTTFKVLLPKGENKTA